MFSQLEGAGETSRFNSIALSLAPQYPCHSLNDAIAQGVRRANPKTPTPTPTLTLTPSPRCPLTLTVTQTLTLPLCLTLSLTLSLTLA